MKAAAAWKALFEACVKEARASGAADPQFYFEGTHGLFIFDGPPYEESGRSRQEAVVMYMPWPPGLVGKVDSGGF